MATQRLYEHLVIRVPFQFARLSSLECLASSSVKALRYTTRISVELHQCSSDQGLTLQTETPQQVALVQRDRPGEFHRLHNSELQSRDVLPSESRKQG